MMRTMMITMIRVWLHVLLVGCCVIWFLCAACALL